MDILEAEGGIKKSGILSPNNQRQHRTSHAPKNVLPLRMATSTLILPLRARCSWTPNLNLGGMIQGNEEEEGGGGNNA